MTPMQNETFNSNRDIVDSNPAVAVQNWPDTPEELTENRLRRNVDRLRDIRDQILKLKAQEADIEEGIHRDCEALGHFINEMRTEAKVSTAEKPS